MTWKKLPYFGSDMPLDVATMNLMTERSQIISKDYASSFFSFTWAADNTPPSVAFSMPPATGEVSIATINFGKYFPIFCFNYLQGIVRISCDDGFVGSLNFYLKKGNNSIKFPAIEIEDGTTDNWYLISATNISNINTEETPSAGFDFSCEIEEYASADAYSDISIISLQLENCYDLT